LEANLEDSLALMSTERFGKYIWNDQFGKAVLGTSLTNQLKRKKIIDQITKWTFQLMQKTCQKGTLLFLHQFGLWGKRKMILCFSWNVFFF